ncbi:MAG: choice-of-anchor D domain-containing protein [Acidobacteriaceae bacterium]
MPEKVELFECFQEVEYVDEILLYPSCDLDCDASLAYLRRDRLRPNLRRNYRRVPLRQLNRWGAGLVVTIVVLLSGCLSLAISGCADAIPGVPTQAIIVKPGSVSFGSVAVGDTTSASVSLVNQSPSPIEIMQLNVTGQSFSVGGQSNLPVTVAAGGAYSVNVRFDPTVTGVATGQLAIGNNSTGNPTEVISLSGTGTVANSTSTPSALSCSNATMAGTGTDTCLLTLSAPAPSGGLSVALTSSNPAVTLPAAVTVPANATSTGFTATVASVSSAQAVTLTASEGGVSRSFALQLNAATAALSINATSVAFGDVTLNTPATQSVILTSTGTVPVTVNAATVSGAGYTISGATLPITLNPGQTITLNVQFDPTVTGVATGQMTITSNSSSGGTADVALTGTGQAATHEVDLSWDAPSSSPDPVAGYEVYRSPSGSSAYQLINSSPDTQTTYVDTTVQSGLSYDYIVKSVDASGNESIASNMAAVTIP